MDRKTLEYIYDEVSKLIMKNFDEGIGSTMAKDMAYRDVLRIITNILNK
jgi:hypothetical protein